MKKIFALILALLLVLCSCDKADNTASDSNASSTISKNELVGIEADPSADYSEWNTKNAYNVMWCSSFSYDDKTETLYYGKYEMKNDKFENSLVSVKDGKTETLSDESADCLYVFDNKLYYTTDENVMCMDLETKKTSVIANVSAKNIVPYWDGIMYITYDDYKIHSINSEGKESVVDTALSVQQFMLYNGKIYYGGFVGAMSNIFELRCYDPATRTDTRVLDESICGFDIAYDKICATNENGVPILYEINGELIESVHPDEFGAFYLTETGLMYIDKKNLVEYNYDKRTTKTLASNIDCQFVCGPYLCLSDYEKSEVKLWKEPEPEIKKYVGKKNYQNASLGWTYLAQNDDCYYYVDFDEFFSIDKKSGKRTSIAWPVSQVMYKYNDIVTVDSTKDDNILFFDTKTKKLTKKVCKHSFGENQHSASLHLTENGIVAIGDADVYYCDRDFKNLKQLPIATLYGNAFVLDDEIFYLAEDYNVYCYNFKTNKKSYVTDYKPTPLNWDEDGLQSTILQYLGNGNILVYGDEKLQIINLTTGKSHAPYTKQELKKIKSIKTIYNDDAIFFMVWTSDVDYYIDKLDPKTYKKDRIYAAKWQTVDELNQGDQYNVSFTDCDENHIYLRDHSSFENGHDFRIKTDGSGKEILFSHMGEEHYSIEKYE